MTILQSFLNIYTYLYVNTIIFSYLLDNIDFILPISTTHLMYVNNAYGLKTQVEQYNVNPIYLCMHMCHIWLK